MKSFTTIEVARLCRVSDATVKRWEEAGLLKSERTSGGHRRFRAEEVSRFQREQGLGLKRTHGDASVIKTAKRTRAGKPGSDKTLLPGLIEGSEEATANALILGHLEGKPLTELIDDMVCPAMREIGELWFRNEISVAQEHLATRTVISALYKLRSVLRVPESRNESAVCSSMEGDLHDLPTLLAQLVLENEGWDVVNFGAATPLHCLADEVLRHAPRLVCITSTVMNDLDRLTRDYKDFRSRIAKLAIPVLLGGRAFSDEHLRDRFPAERRPRSFTELADLAREL